MVDKNMEMMKKIIEEKKKKSASQGGFSKATKTLGGKGKDIKQHRKGGLFDK